MVLFDVSLPRPKQDDDAAEAGAIAVISKTLSALNPDARMRVLRWANERFNAALDVTESPATEYAGSDPMLSLEGLHAFFEPAPARHEAHDAPHPIEREDMGDLFDEPAHRKAELRVVARRETPASIALEDLHDLYEDAVAQHHAEPESPMGDLYEQTAAQDHAEEIEEPIADLYDAPALRYHAELDEPAALSYEETAEAPLEDVQPAAATVPAEDQSLDALVADLASALHNLNLQLEDASA